MEYEIQAGDFQGPLDLLYKLVKKNQIEISEISLAKITEEYLYAEVEDQGQGFDWQKKINKNLKLKSNSDRGRGIMMAVKACDKFYYNKKGNKAFLLKKINFS